MIRDAENWQRTGLRDKWLFGGGWPRCNGWHVCHLHLHGNFIGLWSLWSSMWWRRILSRTMRMRCRLNHTPCGSLRGRRWPCRWSCRRAHRCRRSLCGRPTGLRSAGRWRRIWLTSNRQSVRWLNCCHVRRFVLQQFHIVGETLHHRRQITVAELHRFAGHYVATVDCCCAMGLIQRRTGNLNDRQTAHESKTNIEITCSDFVRQSDFFYNCYGQHNFLCCNFGIGIHEKWFSSNNIIIVMHLH